MRRAMVRFWCLCFGLSRFVSLFFCVFCVFVVRDYDREGRREGPFCLFSFERGQKTEEEKKKSKKKKKLLAV